MAHEPKLLAEIRANKARVEKAEKAPAPIPPPGPLMSASVVTPAVRAKPNNYIAQALDECTTVEHCQTLLEHARAAGYADDGQTVQLIRAKIEALRGGTRPPSKAKPRKRGGRR
jgi:hypothetical protein